MTGRMKTIFEFEFGEVGASTFNLLIPKADKRGGVIAYDSHPQT